MKKILYIGWVGFNNIGDELMLEIFRDLCNKYMSSDDFELIPTYNYVDSYNLNDFDIVVLGGGSLLLDGYIDVLYNAMSLGKKIMVWGSGYDWAEKDFIDLLYSSDSPPYLFSDSTEFKLNELSVNSQFFGVRGPLTYKLLEKSFIDMSNIIISGDPCFLLKSKPMYEYTPILKVNDNKPIVAINWGTCLNKIYGTNEQFVENTLSKVCKSLISLGYRIYIYVMWNEDIVPCTNLYNSINDTDNVILDTNLYCAGQILSILEKFEFSINLKLHANIISSVARTPFICLGYRFKSMDFVKSINCEDLIIFTDDSNLKASIENKIDYISNNYDFIKNKIDKEINKYNSFLETPFINNLFD